MTEGWEGQKDKQEKGEGGRRDGYEREIRCFMTVNLAKATAVSEVIQQYTEFSLVPRPLLFCSLVCVQYNTRKGGRERRMSRRREREEEEGLDMKGKSL